MRRGGRRRRKKETIGHGEKQMNKNSEAITENNYNAEPVSEEVLSAEHIADNGEADISEEHKERDPSGNTSGKTGISGIISSIIPKKKKVKKGAETAEHTEDDNPKADDENGKKEKTGKGKKKHPYKYLTDFIIKLVAVVIGSYIIFFYIFGVFMLRGNYMFPAIRDGDLCVSYRLDSYQFGGNYNIGDVVLYSHDGEYRLGRIVAVEGQTVEVNDDGELIVSGNVPSEQIFYLTEKGKLNYPCTVGENEFFIANDFRSDTSDSRDFGPIKKSDMHGKLILRLSRRGF